MKQREKKKVNGRLFKQSIYSTGDMYPVSCGGVLMGNVNIPSLIVS